MQVEATFAKILGTQYRSSRIVCTRDASGRRATNMTTIARLFLGIVFSWFFARTGDDNWTIKYISIRYNILYLFQHARPLLSTVHLPLIPTDCCSAVTWEKIGGVKPETFDSQTILFSTVNSNGITRYCFER